MLILVLNFFDLKKFIVLWFTIRIILILCAFNAEISETLKKNECEPRESPKSYPEPYAGLTCEARADWEWNGGFGEGERGYQVHLAACNNRVGTKKR